MNIQTMYIKGQDGNPVMINTADFDPATQEVYGAETVEETQTITGTEPQTGTVNAGDQVTLPDGSTTTVTVSPAAPSDPATPPEQAAPVELFVTKQSAKKFIVTDRNGNPAEVDGIETNGYASEAAAWAAIMARNSG